MQGVYSVLPTPFAPDGSFDSPSLGRVIDLFLEDGVSGFTALGVTSEVARISDRERDEILDASMAHADGRAPVIVGATGPGLDVCLERCRAAERAGAAGVMVSPPRAPKCNSEAIFRHFARIAETISIPVVIQDFPPISGFHMEPDLLARICREIPSARTIKLEDAPTPYKAARIRERTEGLDIGIFGGLGGAYLIEELISGATGAMTGFAYPKLLVAVVSRWDAGDRDGAAAAFYRYAPVMRFEFQEGIGWPSARKCSGGGERSPIRAFAHPPPCSTGPRRRRSTASWPTSSSDSGQPGGVPMSLLNRAIAGTLPLLPRAIIEPFARPYIAGETVADLVQEAETLNRQGYLVATSQLGEFVTDRAEAEGATEVYRQLLDEVHERRLAAYVHVKVTQLGLMIDRDFCRDQIRSLLEHAAKRGGTFLRMDMEDSPRIDATLGLHRELHPDYPNFGVVLQARMRRSLDDARELAKVKGERPRLQGRLPGAPGDRLHRAAGDPGPLPGHPPRPAVRRVLRRHRHPRRLAR